MKGYVKITRTEFYQDGGMSNPKLVRKGSISGRWSYFKKA